MTTSTLPSRNEVDVNDTWDLSSLYADHDAWEADFKRLETWIPKFESFRGKLSESAEQLAAALTFDSEFDRVAERLGTFAFLKTTEDQGNSDYQAMKARFQNLAVRAGQASSFMRPEIMSIPESTIEQWIDDERLKLFQLQLQRLLRYRKTHT